MHQTDTHRLRKRLLSGSESPRHSEMAGEEIDLAMRAKLAYTSEDPDHPLEHLVFGRGGWAAAQPDTTARIVIEFDHPQRISGLVYEVEERQLERTQEVRIEVSTDHGHCYRHLLVQEYNFSPDGATLQHEALRLDLSSVTHLSLTIVPNKSGSGVATLASLHLFG